jgi:hypothetical protein
MLVEKTFGFEKIIIMFVVTNGQSYLFLNLFCVGEISRESVPS